jgi:putative ATP-binding cassette transporter
MKIPNKTVCISILVVLTLIECGLSGYIAIWRETFWQAVQNRDLNTFCWYIGYFCLAALTACYVSGKSGYIQSYTALIFRRTYTQKALKVKANKVEGQPQRIQEDCLSYPMLTISLSVGFFKNFVMLITYITILLYQLGIYFLLFPVAYAIIGTIIASTLAKPLIDLNYINQVVEAKFRQALTRMNYAKAHRNNYNLFKTTKSLAYFQAFYNQVTVVVPYIILAPLYFSAQIVFGVFMQCASSMNLVIDCMSYFINSFNDLNRWIASRKRLKELEVI